MGMDDRTAKHGWVVTLDYALRVDDELVESTFGDDAEAIQFLQGFGNIIPGLERETEGMGLGERKRVVIQPADAYGEYDPDEIEHLTRADFPAEIPLEVGVEIQLEDQEGEPLLGQIIAVEGDDVQLDLNHPLAGKSLDFEIAVLDLRPATDQELDHGHVHSHGQH
jgi:FKBP-type peptidyl-prolyl cis-trans isomerase SlyD